MRRGQNAFERVLRLCQRRAEGIAVEQAEERGPAEAEREPAKEFAAVHRKVDVSAVHRQWLGRLRAAGLMTERFPSPRPSPRRRGRIIRCVETKSRLRAC